MNLQRCKQRRKDAFSLTELVVSLAVTGVMLGGVVNGFLQSATQAEWSGYSLAAQAQAIRGMEQSRAAKWDPNAYPPVDQVVSTNFPMAVEVLDIPRVSGNISYATNFVTVTTISDDPPLKMIQVECTWRFMNRGVFTNTVITYRAPDQ